jgi:hypothetical protein
LPIRMSAPPAMSVPPISPGEMQLLLSRAGLVLNPGQVADLVLAWRQVAALIAAIPHDRPLADDLAYTFRLAPPGAATAAPAPVRAPRPAAAKPKAKAKAKAKTAAKTVAKRRVAKPAPRKSARRGR